MAKATHKEEVVVEAQGKSVEELKEIAQTLQTQLAEHQKQANHHQTMAVKAQGALEVMLQLIPKEEVENMIEEEKANGEVKNQEDNNNK
jgi:aspartate aminotransferase-like enzyme